MTCDRLREGDDPPPQGSGGICNTCYHPDYHARAMVAVRPSRLEAVTALVADGGPELGRSAVAAAVAGEHGAGCARVRVRSCTGRGRQCCEQRGVPRRR